jgi:serine/threonine protein kinase/Tol biopolymer transport system component
MTVAPGSRLGHYTILSPLGEGGMGEVWLAEDTILKRKVALKVLPAGVATDPDRLARFQREAEAVAALSHPNIVTIFSVEQDGDVRFLTMERVEGQSLDQVIPRGGLLLPQVLEIGAALADALAASHEKGIIHRDLKPANIMLAGRERRVKVLDFGLAKLREETAADGGATTAALSGEGRILGTVAYMSPEQAEGKPVDARSDLFSLGIVLYEMATGERPFKGETSISVLSAILRDTPKSVTELRADLPRELGRIVRRCLQKDPEQRYQTAKDLRNDLQLLKVDLGSGDVSAVESGARPSPGPRRRRLVRWLVAGAGAVALVTLTVIVAPRVGFFSRVPPSRPFESILLKQVTDSGTVGVASVSPDGRYVVYASGDLAPQALRLRQVATGSDVQIVAPADVVYDDVTFSPDANFIYYVTHRGAGGDGRLYRIAALGGTPERLLDVDDVRSVCVSPDGTRLVFVRLTADESSEAFIAAADGTGARRLLTRKLPERFLDLAWSPDGRALAAVVFQPGPNVGHTGRMHLIDPETGRERDLGVQPVSPNPNRFVWLPDGFLLTGRERTAGEAGAAISQVWFVSHPGGEARRITHDLNRYGRLSATADGRTVVAVPRSLRVNVWVLWDGDRRGWRQVTSGRNARDGANGLDWTPDGRVLFDSLLSGSQQLWSAASDESVVRQLTFGRVDVRDLAVSPDGRVIAFSSGRSGQWQVWRMGSDGANPRQLTHADDAYLPQFTPDGAWIVYQTARGSSLTSWKVPVDGGEPVPMFPIGPQSGTADGSLRPPIFWVEAISPDGRWAAGGYRTGEAVTDRTGFALVSMSGTRPWRELKSVAAENPGFIRFTRDGLALTYVRTERGVSNLWLQPLEGGEPRQLTSFTDQLISGFAWSRDGRGLAVSRGERTADAVMITSEEKK